MGTQQILMIVLAVLVVGSAVAISLMMFDANGVNSKRQMIMSDLQVFSDMVQAYMKTPASMGGGCGTTADIDNLAQYIGFTQADNSITNDNAKYSLKTFKTGTDGKVEIQAVNAQMSISVTATIDLNVPVGSALSIKND